MAEFIKASLAAENGVIFLGDEQQLIPRVIPCKNVVAIGIFWLVPQVTGGRVDGYNFVIGGARPTADAVKTIKIQDNNNHNEDFIAVEDSITLDDFASKCNECCDVTPEFTAPTIPVPLVQEAPCPIIPSGTPVYPYDFPFPDNPNTLNYSLQGIFNGAYASPVPNPAGYANTAAVLTFAQAASPSGWANYGTWSIITLPSTRKILHLDSTTVLNGNVEIGLIAKSYCLDLPASPATINSIVIGGVTSTFPAVTIDRANPAAAFDKIRPFLIGTLTIETGSGHAKYQYTGLQVPATLKNDATTVATWTAGAC